LFGELKTPDKYVFDFNSVVSENKNAVGAGTSGAAGTKIAFSSHDKVHGGSNSVEKFA